MLSQGKVLTLNDNKKYSVVFTTAHDPSHRPHKSLPSSVQSMAVFFLSAFPQPYDR